MRHASSLSLPLTAVWVTAAVATFCAVSLCDDAYGQASPTPSAQAAQPALTAADRDRLHAERTKMVADKQKLAADRAAGNSAAVEADLAQLRTDRGVAQQDRLALGMGPKHVHPRAQGASGAMPAAPSTAP